MTEQLAYTRATLDRGAVADDGPLRFKAVGTLLNRRGYALRAEGWQLENFRANPVVLWMHNNFDPPIGRATVDQADGVDAAITFDTADPFAAQIDAKYRRGFLHAVSVGFHMVDEDGAPIDRWSMKPEEIQNEVFYDLAEISAVPVPADPTAVRRQSRQALSLLGRELVGLFDEQEHGAATEEQIRAAVAAELTRLGIRPPAENDPSKDAARPGGVDERAAQAIFAAFNLQGVSK